jgi:tetratricopeptide (TPR) repeat protein
MNRLCEYRPFPRSILFLNDLRMRLFTHAAFLALATALLVSACTSAEPSLDAERRGVLADSLNDVALQRAFFSMYDPDSLRVSITDLESALDYAPDRHVYYGNLAAFYLQVGRTADAVEVMERAIAIKEDFPEASTMLGLIHHRLGDNAMASSWYERAIEQYSARVAVDAPEISDVVSRAFALHMSGKVDEARSAVQAAREAYNEELVEEAVAMWYGSDPAELIYQLIYIDETAGR